MFTPLIPLPGLGLDRPRLDSLQQIYLGDTTCRQNNCPYMRKLRVGIYESQEKAQIRSQPPPPLVLSVRCQYICRNIPLQDISLQNERFEDS